MIRLNPAVEAELEDLQRLSYSYFEHEVNPVNGLVADKTAQNWPASIAATGFALAAYPVGVARGFISRAAAVERTLQTLRFFSTSPHGPEPDATGYQGFYYHFLDMQTGRRAWHCELSTVDTAFLLAGALTAAAYFDAHTDVEQEIRTTAYALYRRVNWHWAQDGGRPSPMVGTRKAGFFSIGGKVMTKRYCFTYWRSARRPTRYLIMTFSHGARRTDGKAIMDTTTFTLDRCSRHQLSHIWIDFRGIQDSYMRDKGSDYFENSRRATHVQQRYAIDNPLKFKGYGANCWGITASDGPGPETIKIDGIERQFFNYVARGVPFGPDDGTLAPWAIVSSLPFAPGIVLPVIEHLIHTLHLKASNRYGFKATFNATYPVSSANPCGWVSPWHYGIDQGPIVLMIENYRSELLWRLTCQSPYIVSGLRRAGFAGGWLQKSP